MTTPIVIHIFQEKTGQGRSVRVGVQAVDLRTGETKAQTIDSGLDPSRGRRYRAAVADAERLCGFWKQCAEHGHKLSDWATIKLARNYINHHIARYFTILHFNPYSLAYTIRPNSTESLKYLSWERNGFDIETSYEGTIILRIRTPNFPRDFFPLP